MENPLVDAIVAVVNRDLILEIERMGKITSTEAQKNATAQAIYAFHMASAEPDIDKEKMGLELMAKLHSIFPQVDLTDGDSGEKFFEELHEAMDIFISLAQDMKGMNPDEQRSFAHLIKGSSKGGIHLN